MGIGSGLSAQLGYKSETTWGTAVVVDKFLEMMPGEAVKNDGGARYLSQGIRAGRLVGHRASRGVAHIAGPVKFELPNITIAPWLKHMFGTVVTTGTGPYTHTFTPGDLFGKSMTVQVGKPSNDGTVQPFTWAGAKIADWELAADVGSNVALTSTLTAKSETTATALAAASYAATYNPFTFIQATLTIAGAAVAVNSFNLRGNNALKTDRQGPGAATIREQIHNARRVYGGAVTAEFEGLTQYARFLAATQAALVVTISNGTDSLTVTTNVELTGDSPDVAGTDVLVQPIPFDVLHATSDASAITAVLVNSDATAA